MSKLKMEGGEEDGGKREFSGVYVCVCVFMGGRGSSLNNTWFSCDSLCFPFYTQIGK